MGNSINDIQQVILDAKAEAQDLDALQVLTDSEVNTLENLTSNSKVALWRLWVWIIAFAQWTHEQLLHVLRMDIEKRIAETRPFTKQWYVQTAQNYQHGYDLPEMGVYQEPITPEDFQLVRVSKIIKKASVVQTVIQSVGALRIKVATLINDELAPLSEVQLLAFQEYIELMGAAGVFTVASSTVADDLKFHVKIYFNALVLDSEGKRLDGSNDTPVQEAIKAFLKGVDFDGFLDLEDLETAIKNTDGVVSPHMISAASKYAAFDYDEQGVNDAGAITDFRRPNSGYFKLDEVNTIFEFVPYDF